MDLRALLAADERVRVRFPGGPVASAGFLDAGASSSLGGDAEERQEGGEADQAGRRRRQDGDGGEEDGQEVADLPENADVLVPLWLARQLVSMNHAVATIPKQFRPEHQPLASLKADAVSVPLGSAVSPHYFESGIQIARMAGDFHLAEVLREAAANRFRALQDTAQHAERDADVSHVSARLTASERDLFASARRARAERDDWVDRRNLGLHISAYMAHDVAEEAARQRLQERAEAEAEAHQDRRGAKRSRADL